MLETRDNILLELHKLYDLFFKALGVEAPPPGFGTRLGIVPHAVIKSEGAAEGGFPGASTSAAAPVLTYAGLHHAAYPYAVNHLGYAGINHLGYAGYPYHAGVVGYPYAGLPLVAAAPAAEE